MPFLTSYTKLQETLCELSKQSPFNTQDGTVKMLSVLHMIKQLLKSELADAEKAESAVVKKLGTFAT